MAFRQFHGPLLLGGVLAVIVAVGVGCNAGFVSTFAYQTSDQSKTRDLPGDPRASADSGHRAARLAPKAQSAPSAQTAAATAPLLLAMQRAGSHYERGIQEMGLGNTNQAEWEFDAALETLLNSDLNGGIPPRLIGGSQVSSIPSYLWLSRLAVSPRNSSTEPTAPPDPDEPTQEAPALLSPEDLQAIAKEKPGSATPLPEPDVRKYGFPIVFNEQVRDFIEYFQTRKLGVISRAFERASRYSPMIRQTFQEKGLPEELLNLAFIESAVNPWATSRARAAGIWQFMTSTAKLYGLQVSWWVDERRDPEKSTRAASEYLRNLYRMFDSWPLALAAYNAGEGTVQRAIERQRSRDFWSLRLPKETQLFVPAFMAMTIISKEPERYGFTPPADQPFETETVTLRQPADFRSLARAARTSVERLRELNPELIRWSTPPAAAQYSLRIPAGLRADFLDELAQIPPAQRVGWVSHRVRKGETAPAIAKHYGVSLQAVLDMNGLTKRHTLKPGGTVLVPALSSSAPAKDVEVRDNRAGGERPKTATRHKVKKGETLAQVAQTHGVSVEELRRWNNLSRSAALRPGQTLKVSLVAGPATPTAQSEGSDRTASKSPRPAAIQRHVVKKGDTLSSIARAHKVSADDLRRWNGLTRDASLRPGQELRLGDS
jgi:membrane-bound lytic murein transglycosylase D